MAESDKRTKELENEISRLKADLERSREHERYVEDAQRAVSFMMEDLNESYGKLEQAKKEWEATFDAISDPIFIHDKRFRIIRANKAYAKEAGIPFTEIMGRPYYEVFPRMDGPFACCINAIESQETREEEVRVPSADRTYRLKLYPVRTADKKYLYSIHVMEDVTEEKEAAEKLKNEMDITTHLLMIAEATSQTTDIDILMEQVVRCSCRIMGSDACLSYLWDKDARVFRPGKAHGLAKGMIPVFMTETLGKKVDIVKKALEKREPVVEKISGQWPVASDQENLTTDHRPPNTVFPWLPGINTMVAIPLFGKKNGLGIVMGIFREICPIFTERDKKIFQGISHQVSTALEEARLYKEAIDRSMELSHKIETIQAMQDIDRTILSTLKPGEILETATRMIGNVIPCDRATIALVDRERQGFTYSAGFGASFLQKNTLVPFKDTSVTEVIETGRPQYVANLAEVKGLLPLEERFLKDGFLSHIRIPLMAKGEIVGVLTVGAKRVSAYTPENLSTIEKMASQIGVALENARLVSDLEELFLGTVKSLAAAIDAKSPWTAGHSTRVTRYALDIAGELGLSEKELKDLELAGLLHDVGKIGTYEYILDKPDKLTDDEIRIMRQHPGKGAEILSPIRQLRDVVPSIRSHHEFYDGTGYPDGLKGEAIPLFARILTVADTADAMGADRPYRKGRGMDAIVAELKRCSGSQFDPRVVEAFLKTINH